jgi:hypothetical protein
MLPGFRFLLAATVLAISMLIFGLGAAALLRAAHEEFASIPSRRALPEVMFTQQSDDRATLAILRVESSADEQIPGLPATDNVQSAAQVEQSAIAAAASEPETHATDPDKIAALTGVATPAENSPPESAKPETSTPEHPIQAETPAQSDTPSSAADSSAAETKIAAIADTPVVPNPIAMAAPDQAAAAVEDSTKIAETRIATLGGPPVSIETQTSSKLVTAVARKSAPARRVAKRRKIAPRARLALPAPQRPANPFGG